MIEQNVQVIRCQNERLWVQMGATAGCPACEAGTGCGAGVFSRLLKRKPVVLVLPRNEQPVQVGQLLTLAIPESVYLRLVFGAYGLPLLAAIAGGWAGFELAGHFDMRPVMIDLVTLLTGLAAAALALRLYSRRYRERGLKGKLHSVLYYPATDPNMCRKRVSQHAAEDRL